MNTTPQALVEHALVTSTADDCIVIVSDSTSANLRWANNTLTTNGVGHDVGVTVIAFRDGATASVSSTAASTTFLMWLNAPSRTASSGCSGFG